MKLSDYVVQTVASHGVKHVFMLPGGGAMHLNDSLGRTQGVEFVCNLHEQASAIAAEAYARRVMSLAQQLCVARVTRATPNPRGAAADADESMAVLSSNDEQRARELLLF